MNYDDKKKKGTLTNGMVAITRYYAFLIIFSYEINSL